MPMYNQKFKPNKYKASRNPLEPKNSDQTNETIEIKEPIFANFFSILIKNKVLYNYFYFCYYCYKSKN